MRLIDADASKQTYTADLFDTEEDFERVNDIFDYAPTVDAVPVVRCRDCEYVRPTVSASTGERVGIWCARHDILNVSPDDYCSRGLRKGGNDNVSG